MEKIIFFIALAIPFYTYIGYPMVLCFWARLKTKPIKKITITPTVSLIIVVHNEANAIFDKLKNCQGLSYPQSLLEIIVSLDHCDDGTEAAVLQHADMRVKIVHSDGPKGKAAALNRARSEAKGDVLVFTDARQALHPRAVQEMVANFSDPTVGGVTGELVRRDHSGKEDAGSMGYYWKYEKWIRRKESQIYAVIGVTGAIYAIRRELYVDIPHKTIVDDLYIPMQVVMQGYRVVFDTDAKAVDPITWGMQREFGRKVRNLFGNYHLLSIMPQLLSFKKNPVCFQYISHKACRLIVPYALATLFLTNMLLVDQGGFYLVFGTLQIIWYLLAFSGMAKSSGDTLFVRVCSSVFAFMAMQWAAVLGLSLFITNKKGWIEK